MFFPLSAVAWMRCVSFCRVWVCVSMHWCERKYSRIISHLEASFWIRFSDLGPGLDASNNRYEMR